MNSAILRLSVEFNLTTRNQKKRVKLRNCRKKKEEEKEKRIFAMIFSLDFFFLLLISFFFRSLFRDLPVSNFLFVSHLLSSLFCLSLLSLSSRFCLSLLPVLSNYFCSVFFRCFVCLSSLFHMTIFDVFPSCFV